MPSIGSHPAGAAGGGVQAHTSAPPRGTNGPTRNGVPGQSPSRPCEARTVRRTIPEGLTPSSAARVLILLLSSGGIRKETYRRSSASGSRFRRSPFLRGIHQRSRGRRGFLPQALAGDRLPSA